MAGLSNEELRSYLDEHQTFYKNAIDFVESTTTELGEQRITDVLGPKTSVTTNKIEDLEGFDLIFKTGRFDYYFVKPNVRRRMGASYFKRRGEIAVRKDDETLLRLFYHIDKKDMPEVMVHKEGEWEKEFKDLMDREEELIEEYTERRELLRKARKMNLDPRI